MKIFTKKSFIKKIAILCLFLTMFTFGISRPVQADNSAGFGGKLAEPIMTLLVHIGDGIMDVIHSALVNQEGTCFEISTKTKIWKILAIILAVIVAVVVVAALAALCIWGAGAIVGAIGGALGGTVATTSAGVLAILPSAIRNSTSSYTRRRSCCGCFGCKLGLLG